MNLQVANDGVQTLCSSRSTGAIERLSITSMATCPYFPHFLRSISA